MGGAASRYGGSHEEPRRPIPGCTKKIFEDFSGNPINIAPPAHAYLVVEGAGEVAGYAGTPATGPRAHECLPERGLGPLIRRYGGGGGLHVQVHPVRGTGAFT